MKTLLLRPRASTMQRVNNMSMKLREANPLCVHWYMVLLLRIHTHQLLSSAPNTNVILLFGISFTCCALMHLSMPHKHQRIPKPSRQHYQGRPRTSSWRQPGDGKWFPALVCYSSITNTFLVITVNTIFRILASKEQKDYICVQR